MHVLSYACICILGDAHGSCWFLSSGKRASILLGKTLTCVDYVGALQAFEPASQGAVLLSMSNDNLVTCALQVTNARFKNVKSIAGSDCELLLGCTPLRSSGWRLHICLACLCGHTAQPLYGVGIIQVC